MDVGHLGGLGGIGGPFEQRTVVNDESSGDGRAESASEDLAPDQAVTADQIIDGMQQIIARVHAKRARIFGATLTPFKGAAYYYEEGEEKRQTVNHFIQESGEFNGVFDFDEAIQDPENPKRLLPKYDSGDNLHPSDAGYQEMAQTVDLEALSGGQ